MARHPTGKRTIHSVDRAFSSVIESVSDFENGGNGTDDVSQVVLLLDVNPYFWSADSGRLSIAFDQYFHHVRLHTFLLIWNPYRSKP